jgi:putative serine/threonine protein kinase
VILAYPSGDPEIAKTRVDELCEIGVDKLVLTGKSTINGLQVLGKGCTSTVLKAKVGAKTYALKIRRLDSDRPSQEFEAEVLQRVNSLGIGPRLVASSRNFLLMSYVRGEAPLDFVKARKGTGSTMLIRRVLRDLFDKCRRLDREGIDHGELSNPRKHVLLSAAGAEIIDFESASLKRRTSNVTSTVQYFFIGGPLSKTLRRRLGIRGVGPLLSSLRDYKQRKDDLSYAAVMNSLKLVSRRD